jgi:hypothetical protein
MSWPRLNFRLRLLFSVICVIQSEKRTLLLHRHYLNIFHETRHGDLMCYGADIGEERSS